MKQLGQDHINGANKKALMISFIIISSYMIIEAIGGFLTNSLALLSDAGHILSDSISLGAIQVENNENPHKDSLYGEHDESVQSMNTKSLNKSSNFLFKAKQSKNASLAMDQTHQFQCLAI